MLRCSVNGRAAVLPLQAYGQSKYKVRFLHSKKQLPYILHAPQSTNGKILFQT